MVSRTRIVAGAAAVGLALAMAMPGNAVAAPATHPPITNLISNAGVIGVGVIHLKDGSYGQGQYDAILPYNQNTNSAFGWLEAAGWYTGPGYCTTQLRSDDGGATWTEQRPDLGPGQHFIGAHTSYVIAAYSCNE